MSVVLGHDMELKHWFPMLKQDEIDNARDCLTVEFPDWKSIISNNLAANILLYYNDNGLEWSRDQTWSLIKTYRLLLVVSELEDVFDELQPIDEEFEEFEARKKRVPELVFKNVDFSINPIIEDVRDMRMIDGCDEIFEMELHSLFVDIILQQISRKLADAALRLYGYQTVIAQQQKTFQTMQLLHCSISNSSTGDLNINLISNIFDFLENSAWNSTVIFVQGSVRNKNKNFLFVFSEQGFLPAKVVECVSPPPAPNISYGWIRGVLFPAKVVECGLPPPAPNISHDWIRGVLLPLPPPAPNIFCMAIFMFITMHLVWYFMDIGAEFFTVGLKDYMSNIEKKGTSEIRVRGYLFYCFAMHYFARIILVGTEIRFLFIYDFLMAVIIFCEMEVQYYVNDDYRYNWWLSCLYFDAAAYYSRGKTKYNWTCFQV